MLKFEVLCAIPPPLVKAFCQGSLILDFSETTLIEQLACFGLRYYTCTCILCNRILEQSICFACVLLYAQFWSKRSARVASFWTSETTFI